MLTYAAAEHHRGAADGGDEHHRRPLWRRQDVLAPGHQVSVREEAELCGLTDRTAACPCTPCVAAACTHAAPIQRCCRCIHQHTSADLEMLPMHTSAYGSMRQQIERCCRFRDAADACICRPCVCLHALYFPARTLRRAVHVPPSDTAAGFEQGLHQLSSVNSSRMTYGDGR